MGSSKSTRKGGRPSSVTEGKRYGDLVAVMRVEDSTTSNAVWLMRCDCGCRIFATATHLRTLTHCGCQSDRWKAGTLGYRNRIFKRSSGSRQTPLKQIYAKYRHGAQKRGYEFALTLVEFSNLVSAPCHYCGIEYGNILLYRGEKIGYNGVDRKDNNIGYTLENTVACCGVCNEAKMDRSYDEFIEWVRQVYHYIIKESCHGRIEN